MARERELDAPEDDEVDEFYAERARREITGDCDELHDLLCRLIEADKRPAAADLRAACVPELDAHSASAKTLFLIAVMGTGADRAKAWTQLADRLSDAIDERVDEYARSLEAKANEAAECDYLDRCWEEHQQARAAGW